MLDQLRLESYGCNMRVTTAVSLLGWAGIIISVLSILSGILVAVVPTVVSPPEFRELAMGIYTTAGVVVIIIFLMLLIMNIFLIKRNKAGSFDLVKKMLAIICKLFLSLELIASLGLVIFMAALTALSSKLYSFVLVALLIVAIIMCLVWMIFVCLAIHGVRKNRKNLLRAYIIFTLVLALLQLILQILSIFTEPVVAAVLVFVIPRVILSIFYFVYHLGYFVVLYNIMDVSLENGNKMDTV